MVCATAVERPRGARLRVGMVGGGRNAFIGAVHAWRCVDDVIRDKQLSTTLAEANVLVELTRAKGLVFAVTLKGLASLSRLRRRDRASLATKATPIAR